MGSEDSEIILIFVSAAGIILFMAISISFFVATYQKRMVKKDQALQQMEAKFQKELLMATIDGQERERKRLAKDLHDGIGSLLSGLNLNLKHQFHNSEIESKQREFLGEACKMLEDGMADVRRVSHNLMPITLENFGLVPAFEECTEPLQQEGFKIDVLYIGNPIRLSHKIELGVLRIGQELLQNTLKHSQATSISMKMHFSEFEFNFEYADNGIGTKATEKSSGIGIKNIQSRVQALNGKVKFDSQVNEGYKASISIPLQKNT